MSAGRDTLEGPSGRCDGRSGSRGIALRLLVAGLCIALGGSPAVGGIVTFSRAAVPSPAVMEASFPRGPAVDRTCTLASLNPLIFDTADPPDSFDPSTSFTVSGWGAIEQVYQTLVLYNGSSSTTIYPVLADSWTISPDRLTYTFHLKSGVHFSNGDPFNAYTMWFSLYRALATNASPQFILSQNFWYPGVTYYSPANEQTNALDYVVHALDTWNFQSPSAAELAGMMATNQSFQVVDAQRITLRVGAGYLGPLPYTYLLPTLADPIASAVDPVVIQAQGGVNGTNAWMASNMLGTGPYRLWTSTPASQYTLQPDPNYWGVGAAALEPWNTALQPARSSIQVRIQPSLPLQMQDLESGAVVGLGSSLLDAAAYAQLGADPCVVVRPMDPVYGSAYGGWWVYMDQTLPPFNNLSVRKAIVHAIDYARIISVVFEGHAQRWVGPVPPGYPYYNPNNLAPYSFDVALARSFMNESPWPQGYTNPINFLYLNYGDWRKVALLLQEDLLQIGIRLVPIGVTFDTLITEQRMDVNGVCTSETSYAGGPFPIGLEFWIADYLAPDDWTQANALSYGSANLCMARYANATTDALVLDAASQFYPATLSSDYAAITQALYDNATDAWLVVPDQFQAYHPSLRGLVPNPMGQTPEFALTLNTAYAVPPLAAQLSATPTSAARGADVAFAATAANGTPPYAYVWQFGDGNVSFGLGANVTYAYSALGNYTANVTVRDPYGGYATASVAVAVVSGTTPIQATIAIAILVGIVIVAIAAAVVVLLLLRRRRKRPETPVPPEEPPQPPPGP